MKRAVFEKLAATLMVPIVIIPVAAVLQAAGFILSTPALAAGGRALMVHFLPLFFAVAVSIGFAAADGMAALAAGVGYVVMAAVAAAVAGDPNLNPGVLGGLAAGAASTWLFHRFQHTRLPEFLGLFAGKRLVPTLAALAALPLGYAWGALWPHVVQGITALGRWAGQAGAAGAFVYGALDRVLLPTGLHHILNNLIEYQLGAYRDPATGKIVTGEIQRFFSGDPTAGLLMSGFFVFNNFAIPGAALAIAHAARPQHRRRVLGLMVTGALTSLVTGISEPVEFAFIFAAPALWGFHIVATGLASYLTYALGVRLWGYALPMFLINYPLATRPWWIVGIGVPYFIVYYGVFRWAIARFRLPVLGQEGAEGAEAAPAPAAAPVAPPDGAVVPGAAAGSPGRPAGGPPEPAEQAVAILAGLGGAGNLRALTACMSRLRVEVQDGGRVDEGALRRAGAHAVIRTAPGALQVVLGARAETVRAALAALLAGKGAGLRTVELLAPVSGRVVALEEVPDPTFARRLVGDGAAILPDSGRAVAPAAGTVAFVHQHGHAVFLTTPGGLELLIHVGIDTVELAGQGFAPRVQAGAAVAAGEELLRFDLEAIAVAGKPAVTPVLVTNMDAVARVEVLAAGGVTAGVTPLLRVTLKDRAAGS